MGLFRNDSHCVFDFNFAKIRQKLYSTKNFGEKLLKAVRFWQTFGKQGLHPWRSKWQKSPLHWRSGLGDPKKFAPCELGVRAVRTDSSRRANWESAQRELFDVSKTIIRRAGARPSIKPAAQQ